MPVSCSAYGCSKRRRPGEQLQFFGFPIKNPDLNRRWINAVRRDKFIPTSFSKLCGDHFIESDYLVRPGTYVKHLKADAVPSVFPAFQSYYPAKEKKIGNPRKKIKLLNEESIPTSSTNLPPNVDKKSTILAVEKLKKIDQAVLTKESALPTSARTLEVHDSKEATYAEIESVFLNEDLDSPFDPTSLNCVNGLESIQTSEMDQKTEKNRTFVEYIYQVLIGLPPSKANQVRQKIYNILFQAEEESDAVVNQAGSSNSTLCDNETEVKFENP